MKLKQLAFVAILSVAAPIAANAATYNFDFLGDWGAATRIADLFAGGTFDAILKTANISPNPFGSQSVSLTDTFHSMGALVGDWTAQLNVRATTLPGGAVQYSLLSETLFNTSTPGTGVIRSYETGWAGGVPTTTIAAVPGPEAGAGLGALAMGGMALWLKRRRQGDQAAA